jgi:hypothetical protein
MTLRSLSLPNQGLLVWSHPKWLQYILPADSWKKKLLRGLSGYPAFELFSKHFDGNLYFDGQVYNLSNIISVLPAINPAPVISAAFVNSGRNPPRAYVWLQSGDIAMFLKIGRAIEYPFFENEVKVFEKMNSVEGLQVMKPITLCNYDGLVLLLSKGISLDMQRFKHRVTPEQMLSQFLKHGADASGFFGGPVHGDLSSQNVFKLRDQLLIVDWEFATPYGPDYCDLIELGAAIVVASPNQSPNLANLQAQLHRSVGVELNYSTLFNALVFIAERGNVNAREILSEFYSKKGVYCDFNGRDPY